MQKGQLIAGRFELEAEVAGGGMGSIFRALDLSTGVPVALKTWPATTGARDGNPARARARRLARFEREAAALAAIAHPGVVRYIAHGVTSAGEPFLVMAWVAGCDLAQKLRASGLSVSETLRLAERVLSALAEMHAQGVVHRDLKPANVMLEAFDARRAVLVDFGIARAANAVVVTGRGARLGTPCYMSPEQIRDPRTVDGRADVFALGCVVFECLTGTRAFQGDDPLGTVAQVLLDGAPDLSRARPELPAPIVRWAMDLLASDRAQRPFADRALLERVSRLCSECSTEHLGPPRADLGASASASATASVTLEARDARPEPQGAFALGASATVGALSNRTAEAHAADDANCPLFARDAELAQLSEVLGEQAAVVVLWGPPGIGKTRVALELLRRASSVAGLKTRLWIDLSSARDGARALRLLAVRLGAGVSGAETPAVAVGRTFASAGRALAVLDGVDALLTELPNLITEWRLLSPHTTLVVTCRARVPLEGARTLELGPLPTLSAQEIEARSSAAPSPSAQLFISHATLHGAGISARETPNIERIVQGLEGIPLAIELAAARVPSLGVEGVLALCTTAERGALHDALESAWSALSRAEKAVLGACAVFAGSFDAEHVAAVAAIGGEPRILQALREKSLLRTSTVGFSLFSIVRELVLGKLSESGQLDGARSRHAAHVGRRAAALTRLPGERQLEFTRRIEAESDELIAAVEWALTSRIGDFALALSLLCVLEPVIVARGPLPAFLDLIDRALAASETLADREQLTKMARVLTLRARLRTTSGRFSEASADLHAAEPIARASSNAQLEGGICLERGLIHHFQRELLPARRAYERALSLLRPSGDLLSLARCFGNLGAVFHDDGKWLEAAAYYWKAIQSLEAAGDARVLANFLGNLGLLEQELGALPSARRRYEKAISLLQNVGDARLHAITLGNLGGLEAELRNWQDARHCHELALGLLRPLDDSRSLALCRARLGAALAMLGLLESAADELSQAQKLARADDRLLLETVLIQRVFLDLGCAHAARRNGDRSAAESHLERAEAACRRAQRERSDGRSLSRLSDDIRTALRSTAPLLLELRAALHERVRQA
jgi:serine/threonine protein kinase/predicted ATPase